MNPNRTIALARQRHGRRVDGHLAFFLATGAAMVGCDAPYTAVVLDNGYPADAGAPLVVYQAQWEDVSFTVPVAPGSSSAPQATIAASDSTAYVVLAPGWDPSGRAPPTSFVLLESQVGFGVQLNQTLHIPVSDSRFRGHCGSGSPLLQSQADTITQLVFPSLFAGLHYDAATCTTTAIGDGGRP